METRYEIPVEYKEKFEKALARSNRKSAKLGMPGLQARYGNEFSTKAKGNLVYHNVEVFISGETPVLNGWRLAGCISVLKAEDGTLVPLTTTVPGESIRDAEMLADPRHCDHCQTKRDRLETFIVQHEGGDQKQVGRSCLKDFLGGGNYSAEAVANLAGLRTDLDAEVKGFGRGERRFYSDDLTWVMTVVNAVIRNHGWVSRAEAEWTGKTATRSRVADLKDVFRFEPETYGEEYADWMSTYRLRVSDLPTEADGVNAREDLLMLRIYMDKMEEEGRMNDYLTSIKTIFRANAVNSKALGLACSMVSLAERAAEEFGLERKRLNPLKDMLWAAKKTSQFVGEVNKRQVFRATFIESTVTANGDFRISTFVTPDGNILKTFSEAVSMVAGKEYAFKATVKRHSEFKGVKETVINRLVDLDKK